MKWTRYHRQLLVAAALLAAISVAACGGASDPPAPASSLGARADRPVPAAVAHLQLTTSSGAHTSLAALRGKVVVLTDFLTLCGEVCPMTTANMNQLARAVTRQGLAEKAVFVEVTVDPQRDTLARLAAYRALYADVSNWLVTRMDPTDLAAFCHFFGISYERTPEASPPNLDWLTHTPLTYDIAHQDALVFIDAGGHERFVMLGPPNAGAPTTVPTRLSSFLDVQGEGQLTRPPAYSWTVPQALQAVSWLLGRRVQL